MASTLSNAKPLVDPAKTKPDPAVREKTGPKVGDALKSLGTAVARKIRGEGVNAFSSDEKKQWWKEKKKFKIGLIQTTGLDKVISIYGETFDLSKRLTKEERKVFKGSCHYEDGDDVKEELEGANYEKAKTYGMNLLNSTGKPDTPQLVETSGVMTTTDFEKLYFGWLYDPVKLANSVAAAASLLPTAPVAEDVDGNLPVALVVVDDKKKLKVEVLKGLFRFVFGTAKISKVTKGLEKYRAAYTEFDIDEKIPCKDGPLWADFKKSLEYRREQAICELHSAKVVIGTDFNQYVEQKTDLCVGLADLISILDDSPCFNYDGTEHPVDVDDTFTDEDYKRALRVFNNFVAAKKSGTANSKILRDALAGLRKPGSEPTPYSELYDMLVAALEFGNPDAERKLVDLTKENEDLRNVVDLLTKRLNYSKAMADLLLKASTLYTDKLCGKDQDDNLQLEYDDLVQQLNRTQEEARQGAANLARVIATMGGMRNAAAGALEAQRMLAECVRIQDQLLQVITRVEAAAGNAAPADLDQLNQLLEAAKDVNAGVEEKRAALVNLIAGLEGRDARIAVPGVGPAPPSDNLRRALAATTAVTAERDAATVARNAAAAERDAAALARNAVTAERDAARADAAAARADAAAALAATAAADAAVRAAAARAADAEARIGGDAAARVQAAAALAASTTALEAARREAAASVAAADGARAAAEAARNAATANAAVARGEAAADRAAKAAADVAAATAIGERNTAAADAAVARGEAAADRAAKAAADAATAAAEARATAAVAGAGEAARAAAEAASAEAARLRDASAAADAAAAAARDEAAAARADAAAARTQANADRADRNRATAAAEAATAAAGTATADAAAARTEADAARGERNAATAAAAAAAAATTAANDAVVRAAAEIERVRTASDAAAAAAGARVAEATRAAEAGSAAALAAATEATRLANEARAAAEDARNASGEQAAAATARADQAEATAAAAKSAADARAKAAEDGKAAAEAAARDAEARAAASAAAEAAAKAAKVQAQARAAAQVGENDKLAAAAEAAEARAAAAEAARAAAEAERNSATTNSASSRAARDAALAAVADADRKAADADAKAAKAEASSAELRNTVASAAAEVAAAQEARAAAERAARAAANSLATSEAAITNANTRAFAADAKAAAQAARAAAAEAGRAAAESARNAAANSNTASKAAAAQAASAAAEAEERARAAEGRAKAAEATAAGKNANVARSKNAEAKSKADADAARAEAAASAAAAAAARAAKEEADAAAATAAAAAAAQIAAKDTHIQKISNSAEAEGQIAKNLLDAAMEELKAAKIAEGNAKAKTIEAETAKAAAYKEAAAAAASARLAADEVTDARSSEAAALAAEADANARAAAADARATADAARAEAAAASAAARTNANAKTNAEAEEARARAAAAERAAEAAAATAAAAAQAEAERAAAEAAAAAEAERVRVEEAERVRAAEAEAAAEAERVRAAAAEAERARSAIETTTPAPPPPTQEDVNRAVKTITLTEAALDEYLSAYPQEMQLNLLVILLTQSEVTISTLDGIDLPIVKMLTEKKDFKDKYTYYIGYLRKEEEINELKKKRQSDAVLDKIKVLSTKSKDYQNEYWNKKNGWVWENKRNQEEGIQYIKILLSEIFADFSNLILSKGLSPKKIIERLRFKGGIEGSVAGIGLGRTHGPPLLGIFLQIRDRAIAIATTTHNAKTKSIVRSPDIGAAGGASRKQVGGSRSHEFYKSMLILILLKLETNSKEFLAKLKAAMREAGQEDLVMDLLRRIIDKYLKIETTEYTISFVDLDQQELEGLEEALNGIVLKGDSLHVQAPEEFRDALGDQPYFLVGEGDVLHGLDEEVELEAEEKKALAGGIPMTAVLAMYLLGLVGSIHETFDELE